MNNCKNISYFDFRSALIKKHGEKLCFACEKSTVAVCGLGGLGSNAAYLLARAGMKKLLIVDFDKVELSNLNRQHYSLEMLGKYKTDAAEEMIRRFNPFIEIEKFRVRLCPENIEKLLAEADFVIEAFDSAEAKAMLANEVLLKFPEKYLIAASGMAGTGSANEIKTRKIGEHFYLAGDFSSGTDKHEEMLPTRVMLCASAQVHVILRILNGELEV